MKRVFRENGLTIVLLLIFVICLAGMSLSGWLSHNSERMQDQQAALGYWAYLLSPHFLEGLFENWESEFLQMAAYVYLTVYLRQRGSAESKEFEDEDDPTKPEKNWEDIAEDPDHPHHTKVPAAAKWIGWKGVLYRNSLSLAFVILFALAFAGHVAGGVREYNREQLLNGEPPVGTFEFMATSEFWYQSLQNWQSEFLAVAAIVALSIWLRQKDSPESKEIGAPDWHTGR